MSDLLDRLAGETGGRSWIEAVAQSISCHGAIKAGQQLSDSEIRELINGLEQSKQPRTCPHGRPVIIQMSLSRLEKEFGRTG
jgi:DNA mismatch repair protein MutL